MSKAVCVKCVLYLIPVLVFNVLYFHLIELHTLARWISFLGIHLSYLLLCVSSLSYNRGDTGGDIVHLYPKMLVAYGYFISSLIAGVILILINNSTIILPVIVHGIIIGFYLFRYVLLMTAETHTKNNLQRDRRDAHFIQACAGRLQCAMQRAPSREVRRSIERFHDVVNGATIRTVPQVAALEEKTLEAVQRVERALAEEDVTALTQALNEGIALVREREREIMLCK